MSCKPKGHPWTRAKILEAGGESADFPDVYYKGYLLEWFISLGCVQVSEAGPVAIPHTELAAWASNQNFTFEDADAEWLHRMSASYAAELDRSSNKETAAPYQE